MAETLRQAVERKVRERVLSQARAAGRSDLQAEVEVSRVVEFLMTSADVGALLDRTQSVVDRMFNATTMLSAKVETLTHENQGLRATLAYRPMANFHRMPLCPN